MFFGEPHRQEEAMLLDREEEEKPIPMRRRRRCGACGAVLVVAATTGGFAVMAVLGTTPKALLDAEKKTPRYEAMWNVKCNEYDDDEVFTSDSCSEPDEDWCAMDCHEGTACYEVCGKASCSEDPVDSSWGAYCIWEAWANLDSLCLGTFVPTSARRLSEPKANGITCAWHAYCTACDGGSQRYCSTIYHAYYNASQRPLYTGNEPAASALEPHILQSWCAYFNLPYYNGTALVS